MTDSGQPAGAIRSLGDIASTLRGAGLVLAIRIAAAGVGYLSLVLLARWMGATELGIYTYAFAWLGLLSIPAGLGLPTACVRFLPQYVQTESWPKLKGLLSFTSGLTFVASLSLGATAAGGVWLMSGSLRPEYVRPLTLALIGLPVMVTLALASQIGRAFGWLALAYSPSQIVYPALLLGAVALLTRTEITPTAVLVVPISLGLAATVVATQVLTYAARMRPRLRGLRATLESRLWFRTALSLLLFEGFFALLGQTDLVLVGVFLSPRDVAYYGTAVRTAILVRFVAEGIGTLIGPGIARLDSTDRSGAIQRLLRGTLPWSFLPATVILVLLAVAGRPILGLFGSDFVVAYPAMVLLATANVIRTAIGPGSIVLNMTGHQRDCARAYFIGAVANLAGNLLLIPSFGLVGAAISTTATTIGADLYLRHRVRRLLALDASLTALLQRGEKTP